MTHKDVIRIKYFDIGDLHPDYEHPLTKPPGYYLTSDEGSPCERIEPVRRGKFKYQMIGVDMGEGDQTVVVEHDESGKFTQIDLDEFKKQCEDIDKGEL